MPSFKACWDDAEGKLPGCVLITPQYLLLILLGLDRLQRSVSLSWLFELDRATVDAAQVIHVTDLRDRWTVTVGQISQRGQFDAGARQQLVGERGRRRSGPGAGCEGRRGNPTDIYQLIFIT